MVDKPKEDNVTGSNCFVIAAYVLAAAAKYAEDHGIYDVSQVTFTHVYVREYPTDNWEIDLVIPSDPDSVRVNYKKEDLEL